MTLDVVTKSTIAQSSNLIYTAGCVHNNMFVVSRHHHGDTTYLDILCQDSVVVVIANTEIQDELDKGII